MKELLPRVMVLQYYLELTMSVWVDYLPRCRSYRTLMDRLRKEVKKGTYGGYRTFNLYHEVIGVESSQP